MNSSAKDIERNISYFCQPSGMAQSLPTSCRFQQYKNRKLFRLSANLVEWQRAYLPAADSKNRENKFLKGNANMKINLE